MNNSSNKSTRRSKRQRDKRKREESNSSNNNNNEHNSSSRQRRGNATTDDGSISNPQQPPQQSTTTSSINHDSTNQHIGNESFPAYIRRISNEKIESFMGFFTSARNKHQQSAFDRNKELCRNNFVELLDNGGAQLPTMDGDVSGLSPVVHRTRGGGQLYLKRKPGTDFVDPQNDKFGSFTITAAQKNKLYAEKEEEGSFELLGILDNESQSLDNARLQRERFNVRSDKMCSIKLGALQTMAIGDAVEMERKQGSFNFHLQRYSLSHSAEECPDFGGAARVSGAAQRTDISDMETAATTEAERIGIINPNLPQHPHEHLDGNIGAVLHGGRTVQREKRAYIHSLPPKQQESIRSGEVQPIACSSWSPDLPFQELALTFILMGTILHQKNSDNVLHNVGLQIPGRSWGDAFETNHPISRKRAKEENKSIYDATQFDDDERELAVLVIISFISYIVKYGGWLYMDTNEEALKARGGISMVDFIIGLYKDKVHQWTVEWTFSFGDVILSMDCGDDIIRKIVVHRPPCWQGSIAPDVDLDTQAPSMWKRALSNYFRCSLTGTVKTSYATIDEAIGSEDAILEEKVMGHILMAAHHFLWLAMNAHYCLMAASAISKNLLETERNILLPRFHDSSETRGGVLMSGLSDIFGSSIRDKDKRDRAKSIIHQMKADSTLQLSDQDQALVKWYQDELARKSEKRDRAKSIIEQSTLHIPVVKPSKDARLGLGIKKAEEGSSLEVTSIDPGSLFESSELRVGMVIQSINKIPFTSFDQGLALLKEADGTVTIKVFNPLEVSDKDQALVKWYKDELAYHKDYRDSRKNTSARAEKDGFQKGDRVRVSREEGRVWIVKSIEPGNRVRVQDEADDNDEIIFAHMKNVRYHYQ